MDEVVPPLTQEEVFDVCMRLAHLEGFARRLILLDDPRLAGERSRVSLSEIIGWARAAMGETWPE